MDNSLEEKVIDEVSETTNSDEIEEVNLSAENTLKVIATIILIGGIIGTLICLFTIVMVQNPEYTYTKDLIFNPMGFVTTVSVLLGSLTIWASLRVLSDISMNLKELNSKK